jgi:hypothetical protein
LRTDGEEISGTGETYFLTEISQADFTGASDFSALESPDAGDISVNPNGADITVI